MSAPAVRESELLAIVDRIYGAALDPAEWPSVLAEIARVTRSAATSMVVDLPAVGSGDRSLIQATHGLDPEFQRQFAEHYGQLSVSFLTASCRFCVA